jgi:HEAT repeat protein
MEVLLGRTQGPMPPDRLEREVLKEARRRLAGPAPTSRSMGRISMAVSLMICASVFFVLFPRAQDPASLVRKLGSDSFPEREEASRQLKELGAAARSELEKASRDKDAEVAQRARAILAILEVRERVTPNLRKMRPGLEEKLAGNYPHAWTEALADALVDPRLLGEDLDALAAQALRGAASTGERRKLTAKYLERRVELPGGSDSVLAVLRQMDNADDNSLKLFAWAAGAFAIKETVPDILKLLRAQNVELRNAAAWSAGKLGAREAIPLLIDIVEDPRGVGKEPRESDEALIDFWRVRLAKITAGHALAELGAKEAIPSLIKLFKTEWAVIEQGGLPHDPRDLAEILGRIGAEDPVLEILAPAAKNSRPHVRHQAIWALSHLATPRAERVLVGLLEDPSEAIRISALGALGQHPMPQAAPEVAKRLADPSAGVRSSAIWTLRDLGAEPFVQELLGRLGDPDPKVRYRAARVVTELGVRDGVPTLLKEAQTLKDWEQNDALDSLNAIRQPAVWKRLSETPFKGRRSGTEGEILKRVELQTGLKVEPCPELEKRWGSAGSTDYGPGGPVFALKTILRERTVMYCACILEADRIRLVTTQEAADFWKTWWAEATKTGK